jgi:predicted MFS family arabinose efflux permease
VPEREAGQVTGGGLQLLLLTLALLAAVYAKGALGPLIETMRIALDLTDHHIALLQGPALALSMTLLSIPIGLAIDRFTRSRMILVFTSLLLIGTIGTVFAENFVLLFMSRSLVGLGALAIQPAALSILADLFAPAKRGRANTALLMGQFAGLSAVYMAGGWLADYFPGDSGWRHALGWLTLPLLLLVLTLLLLGLREPLRHIESRTPLTPRGAFAALWARRGIVIPLLLGWILCVVALASVMTWAAPVMARRFSLAPSAVGAILGVVLPLAGICGTIGGGLLADFCQRRVGLRLSVPVLIGLVSASAPLGLFALMPTEAGAAILLALQIALLVASTTMVTVIATLVVPHRQLGLFLGIAGALSPLLAYGLAPLAVAGLSEAMGAGAALGTALAIMCVSTAVLAALLLALGYRPLIRAEVR